MPKSGQMGRLLRQQAWLAGILLCCTNMVTGFTILDRQYHASRARAAASSIMQKKSGSTSTKVQKKVQLVRKKQKQARKKQNKIGNKTGNGRVVESANADLRRATQQALAESGKAYQEDARAWLHDYLGLLTKIEDLQKLLGMIKDRAPFEDIKAWVLGKIMLNHPPADNKRGAREGDSNVPHPSPVTDLPSVAEQGREFGDFIREGRDERMKEEAAAVAAAAAAASAGAGVQEQQASAGAKANHAQTSSNSNADASATANAAGSGRGADGDEQASADASGSANAGTSNADASATANAATKSGGAGADATAGASNADASAAANAAAATSGGGSMRLVFGGANATAGTSNSSAAPETESDSEAEQANGTKKDAAAGSRASETKDGEGHDHDEDEDEEKLSKEECEKRIDEATCCMYLSLVFAAVLVGANAALILRMCTRPEGCSFDCGVDPEARAWAARASAAMGVDEGHAAALLGTAGEGNGESVLDPHGAQSGDEQGVRADAETGLSPEDEAVEQMEPDGPPEGVDVEEETSFEENNPPAVFGEPPPAGGTRRTADRGSAVRVVEGTVLSSAAVFGEEPEEAKLHSRSEEGGAAGALDFQVFGGGTNQKQNQPLPAPESEY